MVCISETEIHLRSKNFAWIFTCYWNGESSNIFFYILYGCMHVLERKGII